uniref:G_PROTEIN_RECEP_F1_2 domain-containing protein n=1 Tax=Parastrongyloides trichosuri TaxID=131310 RepID=A0A0N4Z0Y4_PARTI
MTLQLIQVNETGDVKEIANLFDDIIPTSESLLTESVKSMEDEAWVHTGKIILSIICFVMCIIGVITNSFSIIIYTSLNFRKRSINILLAGMSVSDLIVCLLALPVFIGTEIPTLFPQIDLPPKILAYCIVYLYPITIMAGCMSVWMLVSITVDRYLAVCHPFMVRVYCTVNRAKITVAVIAILTVAFNFVRFWEFDMVEPSENTGGFAFKKLLRADPIFMLVYQNIAYIISQYLLPLFVLCLLNLEVAKTILKATEQRRELVSSVKTEHQTAKMMIFVVIVFIFCYTFGIFLNLLEHLYREIFDTTIGYMLNDINNILVVFNSSSNFIFYVKYSTRYRAKLHELISYCCLCSKIPKTIYSEGKCTGKPINNDGYSVVSQGVIHNSPTCYESDKNVRNIGDSIFNEE